MKTSIPRIRSVTFKDGRATLRLLRRDADRNQQRARDIVARAIDIQGPDIAGVAIVVWGADLTSTAHIANYPGSTIPSILVPDFVRNRLLARQIESWTIDSVNESWGPPPKGGA